MLCIGQCTAVTLNDSNINTESTEILLKSTTETIQLATACFHHRGNPAAWTATDRSKMRGTREEKDKRECVGIKWRTFRIQTRGENSAEVTSGFRE